MTKKVIFGHCAACAKCFLYTLIGRCECGGPFNAALEVDLNAFNSMEKDEAHDNQDEEGWEEYDWDTEEIG